MKDKITNKALLKEIIRSKVKGMMTNELAEMFIVMVSRTSSCSRYSLIYRGDMEAHALQMLCRTWDKFNHKKFDNAFEYYITCINSAFIWYLNKENRQRDIKHSVVEFRSPWAELDVDEK